MDSSARGDFVNDSTSMVDCIQKWERERERERLMNTWY